MSEVMKCDACGTVYEKGYKNICIEEKWANGANLNKYDLCLACVERFHQWLDSDTTNESAIKEIDSEHNYIRWTDDLKSNTRKVYSTKPLTQEEKEAIMVEWKELNLPLLNVEFIEPGEFL